MKSYHLGVRLRSQSHLAIFIHRYSGLSANWAPSFWFFRSPSSVYSVVVPHAYVSLLLLYSFTSTYACVVGALYEFLLSIYSHSRLRFVSIIACARMHHLYSHSNI